MAFTSFAPLDTDIFTASGDGSGAVPLVTGPALDYNASLSSDGRWLVFTSTRDGSADLYRAAVDGTGIERLTANSAFDDQGALSPDGRSLAFVSNRGGQADIWVMDVATRAARNLTDAAGGDFRPAWSPDGEWLAFSSDRESTHPKVNFVTVHSTAIYVVRRDGPQVRRLTSPGAFAGSPAWSRDGSRLLVYESSLDDVSAITSPRRLRATMQVASIDVATGERTALTSGAGEKWSPQWVDAARAAFVSGGPDGGLEFVGGAPGARGEFGAPRWSADGRRVVFHREVRQAWPPFEPVPTRDSRFALIKTGVFPSYHPSGRQLVLNDQTAGILHNRVLLMNSDGTDRRLLFGDADRSALAPAWSPAGDRVAFGLGTFFQAVRGAAQA